MASPVHNIAGTLPFWKAALTRRVDILGLSASNGGQLSITGHSEGAVTALRSSFGVYGSAFIMGIPQTVYQANCLGQTGSSVALLNHGKKADYSPSSGQPNENATFAALNVPGLDALRTVSDVDSFVGAYGRAFGHFQWLSTLTRDGTESKDVTLAVSATLHDNGDGTFTVTRVSGSFITDGFLAQDVIHLRGWVNSGNNGFFRVSAVAATVLTFFADAATLTNEVLATGSEYTQFTGLSYQYASVGERVIDFNRGFTLDAVLWRPASTGITQFYPTIGDRYASGAAGYIKTKLVACPTRTTDPFNSALDGIDLCRVDYAENEILDLTLTTNAAAGNTNPFNSATGKYFGMGLTFYPAALSGDTPHTADSTHTAGLIGSRFCDRTMFRGCAYTMQLSIGGQPARYRALDLCGATISGHNYGGVPDNALAALIKGLCASQTDANGNKLPPMLCVDIIADNDSGDSGTLGPIHDNSSPPANSISLAAAKSLLSTDGTFMSATETNTAVVIGGVSYSAAGNEVGGFYNNNATMIRRIRYVWEHVLGYNGANLCFMLRASHSYWFSTSRTFTETKAPIAYAELARTDRNVTWIDTQKLILPADLGHFTGTNSGAAGNGTDFFAGCPQQNLAVTDLADLGGGSARATATATGSTGHNLIVGQYVTFVSGFATTPDINGATVQVTAISATTFDFATTFTVLTDKTGTATGLPSPNISYLANNVQNLAGTNGAFDRDYNTTGYQPGYRQADSDAHMNQIQGYLEVNIRTFGSVREEAASVGGEGGLFSGGGSGRVLRVSRR